jgi:hypothetical protein
MPGRRRWILWVLVTGVAIACVIAFVTINTPTAPTPGWSVIDLSAGGGDLHGRPVDLIGVGDTYIGLVASTSQIWVVTSRDGQSWSAFRPEGLPSDAFTEAVYPGGLNNVAHVLFTDGDAVYLRVETDANYDRLGAVTLYASDANARTWKRVTLRAPAGKAAFPIAAARAGRRRYLAGAVYDPQYGRSYLDSGVWISDGDDGWRFVDAPAFSGDGNQTIFSLSVHDHAVLAGGGDGALVQVDGCCYYPDGIALWRSTDRGDSWNRVVIDDAPYTDFASAAVVGFRTDQGVVAADVSGSPPRTAESRDLGATWKIMTRSSAAGRVVFPRVSQIVGVDRHFVGTTIPNDYCTDCTEGALARSEDGQRWREVTPKFPCGTEGRSSYGFVSSPVVIGGSVAALGGCGEQLEPFNETLVAISRDGGSHWRIRRLGSPTGKPLTAVSGRERIVTLAGAANDRASGPVRAVVVHR